MIRAARFLRQLLSQQPQQRLQALKGIADRLIPDYRLTWHQLDWWHDQEFNAFLERFGERTSFNTHRKWMLWQLLRLIVDVPGNTAECGVFEGASSWLICAATRGTGRTHHLFDSFEGLSEPGAKDGSFWAPRSMAAGEDLVRRNLRPFEQSVEVHKGWIPDRFPDVENERFAFVHVDVDLHQPTLDSFAFFYPRLSPGAVLLCDDYAFTTCGGATLAADSFLADKPEKMISLDGGGGFFIKGITVGQPATLSSEQSFGRDMTSANALIE